MDLTAVPTRSTAAARLRRRAARGRDRTAGQLSDRLAVVVLIGLIMLSPLIADALIR